MLSHNTSVSAGVAVLFSKSFNPLSYVVDEISKGRLLKVRAVFESYVLVFICIYAPTTPVERIIFLDLLCNTLQCCSEEEYLFLGGDFNCTEDMIDRNHIEPHLSSQKRLIQLIQKMN